MSVNNPNRRAAERDRDASFKLFNATTYQGTFANYTLPPLNPPLAWNVSFLPVDGTIRVVSGTAPGNVAVIPNPASVNEHDSVTVNGSFTDPDSLETHSVLLNWGDGSAPTNLNLAAGTLQFSAQHIYPNNPAGAPLGSFTISATITDSTQLSGTGSTSVQVKNVPPTVAILGAPALSIPSAAISLTSSVNDPGTLDTFSYAWAVTKDGAPFGTGTNTNFNFTPDSDAVYVVTLGQSPIPTQNAKGRLPQITIPVSRSSANSQSAPGFGLTPIPAWSISRCHSRQARRH